MATETKQKNTLRIISSTRSWIEGKAIQQLEYAARLQGMESCVGLPDLHPGKVTPVGAVFLTTRHIHPVLIGADIGCGIGLWQTTLATNKIKLEKWAKRLSNPINRQREHIDALLTSFNLAPESNSDDLGTIGSGNHFAELQVVESIHCQASFARLGLDRKKLYLLVHSGSRSLGARIYQEHVKQFGARGIATESTSGKSYLAEHDIALRWAKCNRLLVANQLAAKLNAGCSPILDLDHNSIEKVKVAEKTGYLHRKGGVPSDRGPVVIPGTRGSLSYLVQPIGFQQDNLWTLAHGAGRKWNRSSCRERLREKVRLTSLSRTDLGSIVICDDKELLYEEAPQAYKNIETVIEDMKRENLLQVIATLKPIITYKKRHSL